jgi:sulfonate transport system substrate-binding protein
MMRTPDTLRPRLRTRRAAAALAAVALAGTVAACGSSSNSSSSGSAASASASGSATATTINADSKAPTLVVGDQAGTGAEAVLQAAGLLHTLPFPVKFADFTSGPPILQAMGSGAVDVGGVGDAPPVFAAAGGAKISIVGARRNDPKSAALLVPKGSSIKSIQDLKGKRIAVAQGSSADYHLLTVLTKAGLSTHDVQLVYLQPAEALSALSSGSVDAWDVWSPFVEQAIQKGAKVLVNGSGYGANFSYEVASKAAIDNPVKSRELTQYLKVLNQAYRWSDRHPAAWAKTWAAATGLPLSVMNTAAEDDTTVPIAVSPTTQNSEQSLADAFAKAGLIPKSYSFAPFNSTAFNNAVG